MVRIQSGAAVFYLSKSRLVSAIRGWNTNYRKFILLGRGRTGSNFLRGLLNSHSQIVVFGELFRFCDSIGWEFCDYDSHWQLPRMLRMMQSDPLRFLERYVFVRFPRTVRAVGFKLFYYHAQDKRRILWDYLEKDKNVHIIHLRRENTLRMILSEKIAFQTNRWTNTTGDRDSKLRVWIDIAECKERFETENMMAKKLRKMFRKHPYLDLTYELLCADYESPLHNIQNFLGVEHQRPIPGTYKQSTQTLSEAIINYAELKRAFQGSQWAHFFDEGH
jgi:LPS sulfotransferase NodH